MIIMLRRSGWLRWWTSGADEKPMCLFGKFDSFFCCFILRIFAVFQYDGCRKATDRLRPIKAGCFRTASVSRRANASGGYTKAPD